jgi:RNA polymerase sigma-70 factor, ECF subfamily
MASRPEGGLEFAGRMLRRAVGRQALPEIAQEAKWVSEARAGDREAFGRLYERYAGLVHGVLLAKVPSSDVDDLVQDVFVMALRRLSDLRDAEKFGAWLAAIARNRACDYYRRSFPEDQMDDETPETSVTSSNPGADAEDHATAVLNMVKSLPEAYRETLILRLVEGMTGPEIAARTGMTHGSVRVNLHRGMEQLRRKLGSTAHDSGPDEETL